MVDGKLANVLDDHQPLADVDPAEQRAQQRGLATAGAAGSETGNVYSTLRLERMIEPEETMSPNKISTCVLYVRISLSTEESVSIDRQIEAGGQYAAARGWKVVGIFKDDGVSATHNKPEDRKGWGDLLASGKSFDAVVIWKVDRLARRVIDFLNANEAVKGRNAGIVAVEDPIDMTTAQGEAFAIMLAVFGQLEAATIRARVKAARDYLLRSGRYVGGQVVYGWKAVPNPDGPGFVIVHDEDRIGYVKTMVERTLQGRTLYSTVQWLNEVEAPTATGVESWSYNTVERIVRHPIVAGMMPHNPGRIEKGRGDNVVRDDDGLPVVDEYLAIMPVGQWRAMVARLDEPGKDGRRMPRAMRRKTSGILSGLVVCGEHVDDGKPTRMWRGTTQGRPSYYCPTCHQTFSTFEELVIEEFLRQRGAVMHLSFIEEVVEGGSVLLREATVRIAELGREIVNAEGDRVAEVMAEIVRLKEMQEEAKDQPAEIIHRPVGGTTRTYAEDWAAFTGDEERRAILGHAIEQVWVIRGKQGAWARADKLARMVFEWKDAGQVEAPDDETLASWAG
jgi:DNA invertase Pin-like site-specific DNA recombinase